MMEANEVIIRVIVNGALFGWAISLLIAALASGKRGGYSD